MIINGEKYCGMCMCWLDVRLFYPSKSKSDGYESRCIKCRSIYHYETYDPTGYLFGEDNPNCKLSDDAVKEIRGLLDAGVLSQRRIAEKYNVASSTISRINTGQRRELNR